MPSPNTDLDRIDAYLDSDRSPENAMNLSALDGYLTAIAVAPEPIPQAEWLPLVWGGAEPDFADAEEADAVPRAILSRFAQIQRELGGDPPLCEPVYWGGDDDEPIANDWAEGFMFGLHLRAEAWEPLIGVEENVDMILPMLALCSDDDGKPILELDDEEAEELIAAAPDTIPEPVLDIADYWAARRGPAEPVRRDGPKVGRNAPCPCGSGRKWKQCHGADTE
jgi:uncharacterized protein